MAGIPIETIYRMCPNWSFAKNLVAKARIRALYAHLIPSNLVIEGESDPDAKARIIQKYHRKIEDVIVTLDYIFEKAPAYQDRKNDKKLIDDILFCRMAYGFQPDEYLFFGLEGKSKEERESWISDIDRYVYIQRMNDIKAIEVINNKANTYAMFHNYYGRSMIRIKSKADFPNFNSFLETHPEFVKKKADASMGRTVELVKTKDINREEYFESLIKIGEHVIEERICQSEEMAAFNRSSVNTVRCITIFTRDGIEIPYTFFKTGRNGSFVDNAGAGGIVSGIDVKSGIIITHGHDEFSREYITHPNTGIAFKSYAIPRWDEMKAMCLEISAMLPQIKCIGWDVALTDRGWIIVEGNYATQLVMPQIVVQKGLKKEFLDILKRVDLIC